MRTTNQKKHIILGNDVKQISWHTYLHVKLLNEDSNKVYWMIVLDFKYKLKAVLSVAWFSNFV